MATLAALRELHAFMLESRVLYARCGDLELRLEALPPLSADVEAQPFDEGDDERRSLEAVLHSSGVDAEPFILAAQKLRTRAA